MTPCAGKGAAPPRGGQGHGWRWGVTPGGVSVKLELSSFLLGCGVGASVLLLGRHLRPLLLEVATLLYRLQGRVMAETPMGQESLASLLAEARARVSPYRALVPKRARNMSTRSSSRT